MWDVSSNAAICEDDFWILVYGFVPKTHYDEVLRRFDLFGRVVSQRGGRSNWVLLRYDNNLEAEKALCQHPCTLADGSIVGICRMDAKLNQILDFDANPSGLERDAEAAPHSMSKNGLEENDIILTEEVGHRGGKTSVCEKILALIFGWDDVM
jgi:Nup53/35/40-type RNA recognition motif